MVLSLCELLLTSVEGFMHEVEVALVFRRRCILGLPSIFVLSVPHHSVEVGLMCEQLVHTVYIALWCAIDASKLLLIALHVR